MGFLDKEGLSYFWDKVKMALARKQDKMTPGDGIRMAENTISTESRIVSLTADEYNALPQEEKDRDDIYYAVEETGSAFSGSTSGGLHDVYSTEETRIGTWIDGKPLYRKTYLFSSVSIPSSSAAKLADCESMKIEKVSSIVGVYSRDGDAPGRTFGAGCHYSAFYYAAKDDSLYFYNYTSVQYAFSGHVSIEYTKTTDEAVSE